MDTATLACSTALLQDECLLAEFTLNIRKTHSERLMPLVDAMLAEAGLEREQLNAVAVAAGPGSFTGIRIGVATARALAQGLAIPAVGVSTLEALAEGIAAPGVLICPLLDARRNQVYTALYRREPSPGRDLEILIPPCAADLASFIERLQKFSEPVVFTGEGVDSFTDYLSGALGEMASLPAGPLRLCRAGLVALCGRRLLEKQPHPSYRELLPMYCRLPEAERLLTTRKE
ncbi:MAG: tRNA (adenosine(37)-N6)-threonylcarbamoyltransferase complex dimerization subunit type 1 TsaB [Bacillota bacterium]